MPKNSKRPSRRGRPLTDRPVALTLLLGISGIIGQACTAVIYVLAAREMDPSQYGRVMAWLAVALLTADALDFGQNTAQLRALATTSKLGPWVSRSLMPRFVIAASVCVAWVVVNLVTQKEAQVVLLGLVIPGHLVVQALLVPARASQLVLLTLWMQAGERLVALACFVFLSTVGVAAPTALIAALLVGEALVAITALVRISAGLGTLPRVNFTWQLFSSWRFAIMSVLTSTSQLVLIVVAVVAGTEAGGLYAAASRVSGVLVTFAYTSVTFLLPSMTAIRYPLRDRNVRLRVGSLVGLITLAVGILIVSSSLGVTALFGSGYRDAGPILAVLSIAALASTISQIGGMVMISQHLETYLMATQVFFAVLGVLAVVVVCGFAGATGAAVAITANGSLAAVVIAVSAIKMGFRDRRESVV